MQQFNSFLAAGQYEKVAYILRQLWREVEPLADLRLPLNHPNDNETQTYYVPVPAEVVDDLRALVRNTFAQTV